MKSKKVFFIFFLALPILIFGRFMELFTMIDPSTGFFYDDYFNFKFFLSIILIAVAFLILFMCFLQKNYADKLYKKSNILGIFSIIFSLFFLIYSAKMISDGSIFSLGDSSGYSTFSVGNFIYFFLSVLCAVSFCLFSIQNFIDYNKGKFAMTFPIILWIYRLIYSFIGYTGMANISENVVEIFMISTCLIFFLAHGKIINRIDYQKNIRIATGFGIVAAILCGVSTIPRYILFLIGKSELIHENIYGNPIDLFLMFYIVCFLIVYLKQEKLKIKQ